MHRAAGVVALCAPATHTDQGFISIGAQDDAGELEVRSRGGDWIRAPTTLPALVVNVTDMLGCRTNNRWQSTPHRVKHRSGGDRDSCPYFFGMDLDRAVACLDARHNAVGLPLYSPPAMGDDLLEQRDRNYAYRIRHG